MDLVSNRFQLKVLLLQKFYFFCLSMGLVFWFDVFNKPSNIIWFICVNKAKLFEIHLFCVIVIYNTENSFKIIDWNVNSTKNASSFKFLKCNRTIEVEIKWSEGMTVVFEFLLNSYMNLHKNLLYAIFLALDQIWWDWDVLVALHCYGSLEFIGVVGTISCAHRTSII